VVVDFYARSVPKKDAAGAAAGQDITGGGSGGGALSLSLYIYSKLLYIFLVVFNCCLLFDY
jgi:hypothetical protein